MLTSTRQQSIVDLDWWLKTFPASTGTILRTLVAKSIAMATVGQICTGAGKVPLYIHDVFLNE